MSTWFLQNQASIARHSVSYKSAHPTLVSWCTHESLSNLSSVCPTFVVLASPPALTCHVFTAPSPGVTDMLTHHYHHHQHSQPGWITQASFWLGGVILLRWPKKCLMRGMIGREIRRLSGTISYHLSWRPPPTLTHLILDHSQRSAQFIFYSSSKQAASIGIMLSV